MTLLVASPSTADDEDERERRLAIEDAQAARARAERPAMSLRRFEGRFARLEKTLEAEGLTLSEADPARIEALWKQLDAG